MCEPIQRADGGLEHPMTGAVVEARDQAEAAGIFFIGGAAQSPIPKARIGAIQAGIERSRVVNRHTRAHRRAKPCTKRAEKLSENKNLNRFRHLKTKAPNGAIAAKRACVCN